MKKLRKINPKKRKEQKKAAEKLLSERTALLLDHPTECCICKAAFKRTHQTVKTWQVTVRHEAKTVRLTCPKCSGIISEFLEKRNKEE
tara:strand:- start:490 stop:753 length:264 start_codon:yes stop_codon:yes gene_type:complete